MSVEYVGVYYPFIGYLKEKQTVSLEEFKSKFTAVSYTHLTLPTSLNLNLKMEQLGKTKSKEKKDLKNF